MRTREFNLTRGGRTIEVDRCTLDDDPDYDTFWEVWERVSIDGHVADVCHTECSEPFFSRPSEADVWSLVDEVDRLDAPAEAAATTK